MATTITVDKPLPILPGARSPVVVESVTDVNEKACSKKEWTESRIDLKDLHQHYLKLCKSRLTSKYTSYTKIYYKLIFVLFY